VCRISEEKRKRIVLIQEAGKKNDEKTRTAGGKRRLSLSQAEGKQISRGKKARDRSDQQESNPARNWGKTNIIIGKPRKGSQVDIQTNHETPQEKPVK